jgi:ADP-ribose pyrophosphatase YjhB (NUDIX family)
LPWGWLDFWENPQEWIKRELAEEMWIESKSISKNPAYFITCKNRKEIWIANIIYEVQVDIKDVLNFTPSEECQEVKFFTKEEAEKEQLFPNVKEFTKQYNPENH